MDPQNSQSSYFAQSQLDPTKDSGGKKFQNFWDGFSYKARQIWPYIYQLINFVIYEIIRVLRGIVKIAMSQFKGGM